MGEEGKIGKANQAKDEKPKGKEITRRRGNARTRRGRKEVKEGEKRGKEGKGGRGERCKSDA